MPADTSRSRGTAWRVSGSTLVIASMLVVVAIGLYVWLLLMSITRAPLPSPSSALHHGQEQQQQQQQLQQQIKQQTVEVRQAIEVVGLDATSCAAAAELHRSLRSGLQHPPDHLEPSDLQVARPRFHVDGQVRCLDTPRELAAGLTVQRMCHAKQVVAADEALTKQEAAWQRWSRL
jgi:hypothetical protein